MKFLKSLLILLVVLSLVSCDLFVQNSTTESSQSSILTTTRQPIDNFNSDMDITEKPAEDPYKNVDKTEFYAN